MADARSLGRDASPHSLPDVDCETLKVDVAAVLAWLGPCDDLPQKPRRQAMLHNDQSVIIVKAWDASPD